MTNQAKLLERIITDPEIMVGKPVIMGTRITVEKIIGLLAQCQSFDDILKNYPHLSKDDIVACLLFAREALNPTFIPLHVSCAHSE